MKHIVIFEEGRQPRVVYGVDPATLDFSKILVNPVLPPGIPPHRWKKGDNCIEVLPEAPELEQLPSLQLAPPKPLQMQAKHYALMGLGSLIISVLLRLLLH